MTLSYWTAETAAAISPSFAKCQAPLTQASHHQHHDKSFVYSVNKEKMVAVFNLPFYSGPHTW
jgi:hypothetical protein